MIMKYSSVMLYSASHVYFTVDNEQASRLYTPTLYKEWTTSLYDIYSLGVPTQIVIYM